MAEIKEKEAAQKTAETWRSRATATPTVEPVSESPKVWRPMPRAEQTKVEAASEPAKTSWRPGQGKWRSGGGTNTPPEKAEGVPVSAPFVARASRPEVGDKTAPTKKPEDNPPPSTGGPPKIGAGKWTSRRRE